MESETDLQMAERHVREAEAHIVRQKQVIKELRESGQPSQASESLLTTLESLLASHRQGVALHRQIAVRRQPRGETGCL